jgi:hypothetical protein
MRLVGVARQSRPAAAAAAVARRFVDRAPDDLAERAGAERVLYDESWGGREGGRERESES